MFIKTLLWIQSYLKPWVEILRNQNQSYKCNAFLQRKKHTRKFKSLDSPSLER